ncbi:MAG: phage tail tube protein [Nitrospirota bacterium]
MLDAKALILAKVEATYGVDAVPAAANDAIVTGPVKFEVIEESKERAVVLPYFGKLNAIKIGTGVKLSFGTELRPSGAAGTAPRLGVLFRICNFSQTITPGVKVDYDPVTAQDGESASIYFYNDGFLYKVLGCVGNSLKLSGKTNEIGTIDWEITGLWGGPASITEVAFPTPTYGEVDPQLFRSANFTIDAYAGIIDACEVSVSNSVILRKDANAANGIKRYSTNGREVSFSCDPEVVPLATYNPWSLWDANTPGAANVTFGQTAGKKCVVSLPNVLKDVPKLGEREGIKKYDLTGKANPTLTAGNNEVKFSFQ